MENRKVPPVVTTQTGDFVAAPTKTAEDQLVSAGQRAVNLLWEHTQRLIALGVVSFTLAVATAIVLVRLLTGVGSSSAAETFLYGVANLVIGFYFGRTNHQRVGGVEQGR